MIRSLWTGATGMTAQQLNIDVIANNLANVNTTGFKRSRADFQDLLYQTPQALNIQKYREYASQLELNLDVFNKCLEDKKYDPVLDKNLAEAISLQISSVPTLYVNKQKIEGTNLSF